MGVRFNDKEEIVAGCGLWFGQSFLEHTLCLLLRGVVPPTRPSPLRAGLSLSFVEKVERRASTNSDARLQYNVQPFLVKGRGI